MNKGKGKWQVIQTVPKTHGTGKWPKIGPEDQVKKSRSKVVSMLSAKLLGPGHENYFCLLSRWHWIQILENEVSGNRAVNIHFKKLRRTYHLDRDNVWEVFAVVLWYLDFFFFNVWTPIRQHGVHQGILK